MKIVVYVRDSASFELKPHHRADVHYLISPTAGSEGSPSMVVQSWDKELKVWRYHETLWYCNSYNNFLCAALDNKAKIVYVNKFAYVEMKNKSSVRFAPTKNETPMKGIE